MSCETDIVVRRSMSGDVPPVECLLRFLKVPKRRHGSRCLRCNRLSDKPLRLATTETTARDLCAQDSIYEVNRVLTEFEPEVPRSGVHRLAVPSNSRLSRRDPRNQEPCSKPQKRRFDGWPDPAMTCIGNPPRKTAILLLARESTPAQTHAKPRLN